MRVHIIQPTNYLEPSKRKLSKVKKRNLVPLNLPYLAALVPDGIDVVLTDEKTEDLDFNLPCDCVFLTVWTLTSFRAYDIARVYREKGVPVIMGGAHCYFHSEEALEHADAVAIGEGEALIPEIVSDLNHGRLKRVYRSNTVHDLRNLPMPRRDLLDPRSFARFHAVAVQSSRGCPHSCEFCVERFFLGSKYRMRPVEQIVDEIKATKSKQILFADSNFAGNKGKAVRLMESLIPLKISWSTLWTANLLLDLDFMQLAKRSGLQHVNIGVESIKQETLNAMKKRTTKADRLVEGIKVLHKLGISFSFNLIFGWDTDYKQDFRATLDFLRENKVHVAFFYSFAPHKGTPIYDRYLVEGRILDPENMNRWPGISAKIRPKNLSPEELEMGIKMMYRQFYSFSSIRQRLPLPVSKSSFNSWFINLSQRKMASGKTLSFENF